MATLITGAAGFVGRALTVRLVNQGAQVRAMALHPAEAERLSGLSVEIVYGDITRPEALREVMNGVDQVYHVAGYAALDASDDTVYTRVNVEGVRNVLQAALDTGVRRVLHTSSVAAIGEARGTVATEETPHRGYSLTRYERSKAEGEAVARAFIARGLDVVIVNPAGVQGAGDTGPLAQVMQRYLLGKLPAASPGILPWVWLEDVAVGMERAMAYGHTGERYILSAQNLAMAEMLSLAGAVLGLAPARTAPVPLLKMVELAGRIRHRLGGPPPLLNTDMIRLAEHGLMVSAAKSEIKLGMRYRMPADYLPEIVKAGF